MRFLVAPTAFKGSLSALEAAKAMAEGVRAAGGEAELMPVADGGDGLIESLTYSLGGRLVKVPVLGPLGERRRSDFAMMGSTAVVEMARASGLALTRGRLDPLGATTYGTGQLIRAALDRGARRILIGMGGSASNDGGSGCVRALGARLLDAEGRELPFGGGALSRLARIDASGLDERLRKAELVLVSDVSNPLLGPRGSAAVYGPQKGASAAQVRILEAALTVWDKTLRRDLKRSVARVPGAGAAGGLGAGLLAFTRAKLEPGSELVLGLLKARVRVRRSDWVLTGEGSFDRQSLYGKAPAELARLAAQQGRRTLVICGRLEPGLRLPQALGIAASADLLEGRELGEAMSQAPRLLSEYAESAARLALAGVL